MLDKLVSQGTCNLKTFPDQLALKAQETPRKKSPNNTLCKHQKWEEPALGNWEATGHGQSWCSTGSAYGLNLEKPNTHPSPPFTNEKTLCHSGFFSSGAPLPRLLSQASLNV